MRTRSDDRPDRRCRGVGTAATAALLVALTGCGYGPPEPRTVQAEEIRSLLDTFFYTGVVVVGITAGLILYAAIRYRRRSDELPRQFRYHVPLEVTYTAIPVVIVLVLFLLSFRVERRVDALVDRPDVVVDVTGFQWQWQFDYPEHGISIVGAPQRPPTMVVPVGKTIRINLRASDVIHSFYVPEFLFKRDTIPGRVNEFDVVIPRAGRFPGECAEFCGVRHHAMNFYVHAVPQEEFDRWVADHAGREPVTGSEASP